MCDDRCKEQNFPGDRMSRITCPVPHLVTFVSPRENAPFVMMSSNEHSVDPLSTWVTLRCSNKAFILVNEGLHLNGHWVLWLILVSQEVSQLCRLIV